MLTAHSDPGGQPPGGQPPGGQARQFALEFLFLSALSVLHDARLLLRCHSHPPLDRGDFDYLRAGSQNTRLKDSLWVASTMAAADVRDMLDLPAEGQQQPRPNKKQKAVEKRPGESADYREMAGD